MFDRMDKKNNVIGFKTNSALALFTSILAENNHVYSIHIYSKKNY